MRNFKTISAFIFLLLFSWNVLLAQNSQPTPYQKKYLELCKKWYPILTMGHTLWTMSDEVFFEKLAAGMTYSDFLLEPILYHSMIAAGLRQSREQGKKIGEQMKNEFSQVGKLKSSTDLRLEKEAKFYSTLRGTIQKRIKSDFQKWSTKGEFEKQFDFEERLRDKSLNKFIEICIEICKTPINTIIKKEDDYSRSGSFLKKELQKYNPEDEAFTILFKFGEKEWTNKLKIPISEASDLKANWDEFRWKINYYDWCFVENELYPTLITLKQSDSKNPKEYSFDLPLQNQKEISIAFNDLGISNEYLKGYVFRYSNIKAMEEEQQRIVQEQAKEQQRIADEQLHQQHLLDSIEVANYNKKLESIFQDYNQQLLQNPYNLAKENIPNFKKIEVIQSDNYSLLFNAIQSNLKYIFDQLNRKFESERFKEYRENKNLFASVSAFDFFYTKGKDAYQIEIQKRKEEKEKTDKLNYLSSNVESIQSINFSVIKKYTYIWDINQHADADLREFVIIKKVISLLDETKNKPYYPQVIEIVILNNTNLNKEWTKNGNLFEGKIAFYEAFISQNYKDILKSNKKK